MRTVKDINLLTHGRPLGRRASYRDRLLGWLPVALTLLIGGAASSAIIALHRNADSAERARITVAEIQRNVQNANNILSRPLPSGARAVPAGTPPPTGLSTSSLQSDNAAHLAALRSSTGDRTEIDAVSDDLRALNSTLQPTVPSGGLATAQARGRQIVGRVERSLDQLARKIRIQGAHAATLSQAGTWLITLVAALAVGVFLRRLDLRRRRETDEHAEALQALALIDPLTRLGNRRQLEQDLAAAAAQATSERPLRLSMFDLDGFKGYNDAFGHHEGDLLLRRLANELKRTVGSRGRAYRLGGDEFCVLSRPTNEGVKFDRQLRDALSSRGEGFSIGASAGSVLLPKETHDGETAMQWADARMYRDKESARVSAGEQTRNVALQMLAAHESGLVQHSSRVAELARDVGERLKIGPKALGELIRAAELHDVGKVAIPFSILEKPAPLDAEEWEIIRRHPVVGANILSAAPALAALAPLVRAAHERYDGGGYPDGLAGDEIPLASRIIFACDALDAMTSDRAYRSSRSEHEALEEIGRCAGTQFDPEVVVTLREVLKVNGRASACSSRSGREREPGSISSRRRRPDVAIG